VSNVHNYLILPSIDDWESVAKFNKWLGIDNGFIDISPHSGGTKHLEAEVWALAVNYNPNIDEMISKFKSYQWKNPSETLLLHKHQDANTWTAVKPV